MRRFWRGFPPLIEREVYLSEREARDLDTEVEVDQGVQVDCQNLAIPSGVRASLLSAMT
jgi:hypothetical protein